MQKIILLGYMGSGKSTIGKILAQELQIPFLDLDLEIEKKEQKSVPTIFAERGEIYFRKIESHLFNQILDSNKKYVLALGGGTPCYANNHLQLTRHDAISVYLKASIETLKIRLENQKEHRPILNNSDEDLQEFIPKHLFERSYFYNQANIVIGVDDLLPTEIVSKVLLKLT